MPQVSIFKTILKFLSGVERIPKAMLKKRAERRERLQGRYKACDELLLSIQPIIDQVQEAKQTALQTELDALEKDFDYVCKHFKSSTPELDKRLEVIILKARTLKILAACLAAINDRQYANTKQHIQDLLDGIDTLKQTQLNYEEVNSGILIAYKQELSNLETKTAAQLEASGISFRMSD